MSEQSKGKLIRGDNASDEKMRRPQARGQWDDAQSTSRGKTGRRGGPDLGLEEMEEDHEDGKQGKGKGTFNTLQSDSCETPPPPSLSQTHQSQGNNSNDSGEPVLTRSQAAVPLPPPLQFNDTGLEHPGAVCVRGPDYQEDESEELGRPAPTAGVSSDERHSWHVDAVQDSTLLGLAVAREVTDSVPPPVAVAEPEPVWTKRRVRCISAILLVLIATLVGIVTAVVLSGKDGPSGPTPAPTPAPTPELPDVWTQLGQSLEGEAERDRAGGIGSVCLSRDGFVVAVGAPHNNGNGPNAGHVRVYQRIDDSWNPLGQDIDGEAPNDESGRGVALSYDGSTLAIGAQKNNRSAGHARVYRLINGSWEKVVDKYGEGADDHFGISVSLSSNGNTLAVGASQLSPSRDKPGYVKVFRFNGDSSLNQIGKDLQGASNGDNFGLAVSLSADGLTLAVGAPGEFYDNDFLRYVCIHRYEQDQDEWIRVGQCIDGKEASARSFGFSVSLSDDGATVAIGAPATSGTAGLVQVYELVGEEWEQVGETLRGQANDFFGGAVSLSSNGLTVAIGTYDFNGFGRFRGYVVMFELKEGGWTQFGRRIKGEGDRDSFGFSVSLSGDGTIVAAGAPSNDKNGVAAGQVRVFRAQISE